MPGLVLTDLTNLGYNSRAPEPRAWCNDLMEVKDTPIVSIVVPSFGLTNFILRIPKSNPKKGTTMGTVGNIKLVTKGGFRSKAVKEAVEPKLCGKEARKSLHIKVNYGVVGILDEFRL